LVKQEATGVSVTWWTMVMGALGLGASVYFGAQWAVVHVSVSGDLASAAIEVRWGVSRLPLTYRWCQRLAVAEQLKKVGQQAGRDHRSRWWDIVRRHLWPFVRGLELRLEVELGGNDPACLALLQAMVLGCLWGAWVLAGGSRLPRPPVCAVHAAGPGRRLAYRGQAQIRCRIYRLAWATILYLRRRYGRAF
jgi:hypothetical protein